MSDLAKVRAGIEETLQTHPPREQTALLTRWVVIAEYVDDENKPWLSRIDSEGMTVWLRKGMLFDALHDDDWESEEVDDWESEEVDG